MNDDTTESGPRKRYFRYAVFALAAVLVLSLGFVLIPREPDAPAPPPLSEQVRAAAFSDAVELRARAQAVGDAADAARQETTAAAARHAVILLTVQAGALKLPADMLPADPSVPLSSAPAGSVPLSSPPVSSLPVGSAGASSLPDTPSSAPVQSLPSAAEFAVALHSSGARRLGDAGKADGGIARLLAGTGIAQLLAAEEIAAATGAVLDPLPGRTVAGSAPSLPALPFPAASSPAASSPAVSSTAAPSFSVPSPAAPSPAESSLAESSPAASPPAVFPPAASSPAAASAGPITSGCTAAGTGGGANLASSFASIAGAELELVYAYQAALTRLSPATAAPASDFLARHEGLSRTAEAAAAAHCAALPPTPAGYALDAAFLADPAAALGALEAGTLPAYGDLIALSDGAERAWAVAALESAVRRAAQWGASPGPVPGTVLDESALPTLPPVGLSPSTSRAPSPGTP